jgi:hypothetical protein
MYMYLSMLGSNIRAIPRRRKFMNYMMIWSF